MAKYTTHYSLAQKADDLALVADNLAQSIVDKFNSSQYARYYPLFAYTGMSGVALATAITQSLHRHHPNFRYDMAYVRKVGEKSHGSAVEFTRTSEIPNDRYVFVFVDDCIDSGDTMKRVISDMQQHFFFQGYQSQLRNLDGLYFVALESEGQLEQLNP